MPSMLLQGIVVAVCRKPDPGLPKIPTAAIQLIEDYGVEGDYHAGQTVRHRFLAKKDPTRPNRRQVLLADASIYADLAGQEIELDAGSLGENLLLDGVRVMDLAVGARLEVGPALIEISEVRNPCFQLNEIHPRLLKAVAWRAEGRTHFNAGVMARILRGGLVRPGDAVNLKE